MNPITLNSLRNADARQIQLGMLWRCALIVIASNVTGVIFANILGMLIGNVLTDAGQTLTSGMVTALTVLGATISILISAFFIMVYVRWLLAVRIGSYRLTFMRDEIPAAAEAK